VLPHCSPEAGRSNFAHASFFAYLSFREDKQVARSQFPGGSDRELFRTPPDAPARRRPSSSTAELILLAAVLVIATFQLIW
jgi:hypothetical protein